VWMLRRGKVVVVSERMVIWCMSVVNVVERWCEI
jgi:hypothetical protein